MKRLLMLFFVIGSINAHAQKPDKFAKTITPAELKEHLYIVASAEMEGRETATPGQRKAAAYIEGEFKKIGLQPGNNGSYQMYYNVYQDSLTGSSVEVNGQKFELNTDFNPSPANYDATLRFSEVVLVGANSLDTLKNADLAGKLVMFIGNMPMGRRGGNELFTTLQSKNIAGVLSVSNAYPRKTPAPDKGRQTLHIFTKSIQPQQYTISENVARAIIGSDFENVKANKALLKSFNANILLQTEKEILTAQSSNVVGVLPGTDLKDEYLFITAHYDHLGKRGDSVIYYGADDDGSGTVGVLEIAEAFAKAKEAGKGPRRSIVFMTVSGEEKGLWGSEYYGSNPLFPLDKTTADLNIDMIGRSDADRKVGDSNNYVYVVGDDKLSSDLKTISESVNKKYTKLELDYKFNDPNDKNRIYYRSDHYNFAKNGVPIIFYYDGMLGADYHKPTDTPDKINYKLLAKRAQLVFYTAWEMANRNDMLKRDIPLDSNVFNR
jgi:Zn-dependent M28 family amino/carboxypeptidase